MPRDYAPQQRRFQTYLECDLAGLLECWSTSKSITEKSSLTDEFLEFFLFFSPAGYRQVDSLLPLIQRAIRGSSEYRVGVGEGLRERAFEALRQCIQGFLSHKPNELFPKLHLELCREQSFILLYRLLFIMFAEDRRLLPYHVNSLYTNNRSLGRYRGEIGGRLDRIRDGEEEDFSHDSTAIWGDLQSLFDLVDRGHRRYGVPEYNGGLFDADAHPFLGEKCISDYHMSRIIDQLGRAEDPVNPGAGLFAVDYRDLAIQHLGGIYEGLLELHPTYALENMVVISRRAKGRVEERYLSETDPMPRGWQLTDQRCREGSIYLETKKGERRASGSYYTPDHIVNHIVENTLGPVCKAVSDELDQEIAAEEDRLRQATGDDRTKCEARLEKLRSDFDDRILRLKVLDPAMGSGHFLIRASQRLAEEIATHQYTGDESLASIPEDESAVSYWKRRAVENCIYGVDINGLAVELAKLALWLETVSPQEPLSFLNHHLRQGNSLVGGRVAEMGALPGEGVLGTYLYGERVEQEVPALLEPLLRIGELPSGTAEDVKEKDRLYHRFEKARESFRLVGDLWCSGYYPDSPINPEVYGQVIERLGKPRSFARLAKRDWFVEGLQSVNTQFTRCFHWELEFPDVFFEGSERRENTGFDAVIGNPPYDVLSELETGRELTALKEYIEGESIYDPSRKGENNLYKLFICRALELLRHGGYLGFITPMAVLALQRTLALKAQYLVSGVDANDSISWSWP